MRGYGDSVKYWYLLKLKIIIAATALCWSLHVLALLRVKISRSSCVNVDIVRRIENYNTFPPTLLILGETPSLLFSILKGLLRLNLIKVDSINSWKEKQKHHVSLMVV
jgi:hypothetical protein